MADFPSTQEQAERSLDEIEILLKQGDVAALITEAIQGDGGNVEPPVFFHPALRELTRRYGTVMICDEVQSGVGRSGEWWEIQTFGVVPDILCTAKAITSGYIPLSACVAPEAMAASLGKAQHLFTYSGHPPACAVALKVLDVIEKEGLRQNAFERGKQLRQGLQHLVGKYPCAVDVRGRGLHVGFEVKESGSGQSLGGLFALRCVEKGPVSRLLRRIEQCHPAPPAPDRRRERNPVRDRDGQLGGRGMGKRASSPRKLSRATGRTRLAWAMIKEGDSWRALDWLAFSTKQILSHPG